LYCPYSVGSKRANPSRNAAGRQSTAHGEAQHQRANEIVANPVPGW
jgi:hypothetical protein